MKSTSPKDESFRYIDIESIDNEKNIISNCKNIKTSEAPSRATRELSEGDILFSLVRPYLKNIAVVTNSYHNCIASTGFYVCKPKDFLMTDYLFYYLISNRLINSVMRHMKGTNSPSIKNEFLENEIIGIPSLKEQHRIILKVKSLMNLLNE